MTHKDVFLYKSVSDLSVTIVQPRDMNFRGGTTLIRSNFIIFRFAHIKNFPCNFKENRAENMNDKKI